MNARDLRIGNIVFDKSKSEHDFEKLGNGIYRVSAHAIERFDAGFMDLQPVPLTSEWLERFGFQLSNELKFWFVDDRNYMHVNVDQNDNGFFEEMFGVKISYVHQLQNWWFIVTGSELKLNDKKL